MTMTIIFKGGIIMGAIRHEMPEDIPAIRCVLEQAFGQAQEADLVDALRRRGMFTLSLVAVQDDQIVGQILFTPATIASERSSFDAVALGPMAVLPSRQRQGIGSQLVRAGLETLRQDGQEIVVVLGHPNYYPRFGFVPSKQHGIGCEFDVPDEVFMVAELRAGALSGRCGTVRYLPEFRTV
jgi:putative acetyltransferase